MRVPTIRRKSTGLYFVRWAGRDWSLSTDLAKARALYLGPDSLHPGRLAAWQAWKAAGGGPLGVCPARTAARGGPLVIDVAEDMLESYRRRGHEQSARSLATSLKRFLHVCGATPIVELARVPDGLYLPPVIPRLEGLREAMLTPDAQGLAYAARTINHDLGAVRLLFQFAARRGLCPPVSFTTLGNLTPPAAEPDDLPPQGVAWLVRIARRRCPALAPLLLAQYYTLTRTSEVLPMLAAWRGDTAVGVVRSRTEWGHDLGESRLLELVRHKGAHRGASYRRFVLITPPAASALDAAPASPPWGRADGYQHASLRWIGHGPRVMRDSAASNLRLAGVDSADVDLLLGHQPRGALGSYARAPWPALAARACRLALPLGP